MFAELFDAMQVAVALLNGELHQSLKAEATKLVDECFKEIKKFEKQRVFQQKNNWDYFFEEVFENMLKYNDCRDVILKSTIDEVLCRLYLSDDCNRLKITLNVYGETRNIELWDVWSKKINIPDMDDNNLSYLKECNNLILRFLERLEWELSRFGDDGFTFYGNDRNNWIPIKSEWNKGLQKEYKPEQEAQKNVQEQPKLKVNGNSNRSKGRPSKPFADVLVKDKEATKSKLHSLIDGKQDSKAVIYIKAAIQLGMIQKPTHTQIINEFGRIVSKQIFNKYINGSLYSDDELKGAKQALANE